MGMPAGTIIDLMVPERLLAALSLRQQGLAWREVARELGHTDHIALYRDCRTWDAAIKGDVRYASLQASVIEVAQEATAQTMQALLDEKIPPTQLPIVMGIAVDKVERLNRATQGAVTLDPMVEALRAIHAAGGGRMTIEIGGAGVAQASVAAPAIDVEPVE